MTSEPRQSDELRPEDGDPFGTGDDAIDDLDRTFADVEHEVGHVPAAETPAPAPTPPVQADADDFAKMSIADADDVFVIDDEEAAQEAAKTGTERAPAGGGPRRTPGSLEEELFTHSAESGGAERFGDDSEQFSERKGGPPWGGSDLSPHEIGIDAREGDDRQRNQELEEEEAWSAAAEEDLQIVEDEAAVEAGGEAGQPESLGIQPLDEEEVSAPASGVWGGAEGSRRAVPGKHAAAAADADADAQQDDESFDPIYGTEATTAASEADAESESPDYSEYEEAYVDQTPAYASVVGAPLGPRRRGPLTLIAAAALILCGVSAGVVFMRPEWLGLQPAPALVDRAVVARPLVALEVALPPAPSDDGPGAMSDPLAQADPQPVPIQPEPSPEPLLREPSTQPTPEPVAQAEPAQPAPTRQIPAVTLEPEIIAVGEDLQIGRAGAMPDREEQAHQLAAGLVTGSQAFAQLKNLNFFLGRVKAMDSSYLTLELTPGEVTLAFDDLNVIVPLASDEYRMMQGSAEGFVRLTNSNKLFGKILTSSLADNVVLEVQQSHVVIPRTSIEEVGQQTRTSVQVLQEDDTDWIKTMLQQQAAQQPAGRTLAPTPTPTPPAGAGGAPPAGR